MFPKNYVPTLAIRPSEMKGLEFLPGKIKDQITPCILLAPWAGISPLNRAIKRVERAFPGRNYFLDIDRNYQYSNLEGQAQQELLCLSDSANWTKWIEFIKKNEHVFPCIQFKHRNETEIRKQIKAVQELGRQYCMRIECNGQLPSNFDEIVSAFSAEGAADFTIILEGGWTENTFILSTQFERLITNKLQKIDVNVPIVISYTSIPRSFSNFNGINSVQFHNRQMVQKIKQKSNRPSIIYGDWGSTHPRESNSGGGGHRITARIDYPTDNAWYIARNSDEGWDFERVAQKLIDNSEIWDAKLDTLGSEMIRRTAINEKIGINSRQKNITARVNIHLHRQALYEQDDMHEMNLDDDWKDEE